MIFLELTLQVMVRKEIDESLLEDYLREEVQLNNNEMIQRPLIFFLMEFCIFYSQNDRDNLIFTAAVIIPSVVKKNLNRSDYSSFYAPMAWKMEGMLYKNTSKEGIHKILHYLYNSRHELFDNQRIRRIEQLYEANLTKKQTIF